MHGGTVHADSAGLGQGCEIVVRLPVSTTSPMEGVKVPPIIARSGEIQRHILVVDDNKFSADSLALILQLGGHDTRVAYSGPDALELASNFRPDVVLMDIGLPAMDGFEVARRLRARADTEGVLLVAVTGYGHEEVLQKAKQVGFDHHLLKPLDLDTLLALLSLPMPTATACGSSMHGTPPIAEHSSTN